MRGEQGIQQNLMVDVPPWSSFSEDQLPVSGIGGAAAGDYFINDALMAALQRYLPANGAGETEEASDLSDPPIDAYSCDEFRMYEFKIRRCVRGRSHDWTECPYAHPGEKARRRDPKNYHYSGTACPDFRKGNCKRGDACEFSHGVFECWLHPARYRTQPCKDGTGCRRRVCFFAHTPEQLRVLSSPQQHPRMTMESYDGSPMRLHAVDAYFGKGVISASPTSTLNSPPLSPPADSPPISPASRGSWALGSPVNDVLASLRTLQLSKVNSVPCSPWGGVLGGGSVIGLRPGFCSLPSTPVKAPVSDGGWAGEWIDSDGFNEEAEPVERVESGRALRAKMYERLSRKSGLGRPEVGSAPDVGWVSELVK